MISIDKKRLFRCTLHVCGSSAAIGAMFGYLAGTMYGSSVNVKGISGIGEVLKGPVSWGILAGGFWGLIVGIGFMRIMANYLIKDISVSRFMTLAVYFGVLAGIVCTYLLHLSLGLLLSMKMPAEEIGDGLLAWIGVIGIICVFFGVPTGSVLGDIAAKELWYECRIQANSGTISDFPQTPKKQDDRPSEDKKD